MKVLAYLDKRAARKALADLETAILENALTICRTCQILDMDPALYESPTDWNDAVTVRIADLARRAGRA